MTAVMSCISGMTEVTSAIQTPVESPIFSELMCLRLMTERYSEIVGF